MTRQLAIAWHCLQENTVECLFSRASNFADFVDFRTSMKFVSLKISGNTIVTRIADCREMQIHENCFLRPSFQSTYEMCSPRKIVPYGIEDCISIKIKNLFSSWGLCPRFLHLGSTTSGTPPSNIPGSTTGDKLNNSTE